MRFCSWTASGHSWGDECVERPSGGHERFRAGMVLGPAQSPAGRRPSLPARKPAPTRRVERIIHRDGLLPRLVIFIGAIAAHAVAVWEAIGVRLTAHIAPRSRFSYVTNNNYTGRSIPAAHCAEDSGILDYTADGGWIFFSATEPNAGAET